MSIRSRFKRAFSRAKSRAKAGAQRTKAKSKASATKFKSAVKKQASRIKTQAKKEFSRAKARSTASKERRAQQAQQARAKVTAGAKKYVSGVKERAKASVERRVQRDIKAGVSEQKARRRQELRTSVARGIATGATYAVPFGAGARVASGVVRGSKFIRGSTKAQKVVKGVTRTAQVGGGLLYAGSEAYGFAVAEDRAKFVAGAGGRLLGTGAGLVGGVKAVGAGIRGYRGARDPFVTKLISKKTKNVELDIATARSSPIQANNVQEFASNIKLIRKTTTRQQQGFDWQRGTRRIKETSRKSAQRFRADTKFNIKTGEFGSIITKPKSGRIIGVSKGVSGRRKIGLEERDISLSVGAKLTPTGRKPKKPSRQITGAVSKIVDVNTDVGRGLTIETSLGKAYRRKEFRVPEKFPKTEALPFRSRFVQAIKEEPIVPYRGSVGTGRGTKTRTRTEPSIGSAVATAIKDTLPKAPKPTGRRRGGRGTKSTTQTTTRTRGGLRNEVLTATRVKTKKITTTTKGITKTRPKPITIFRTPQKTTGKTIISVDKAIPPRAPPGRPPVFTGGGVTKTPPIPPFLFRFGGSGGGIGSGRARIPGTKVGGAFTRSFTAQVFDIKAPKTRKLKRRYTGLELRV